MFDTGRNTSRDGSENAQMLHRCGKDAAHMLQRCCKDVAKMLQICCKDVAKTTVRKQLFTQSYNSPTCGNWGIEMFCSPAVLVQKKIPTIL